MNYTMRIYKTDKRTKSGERITGTYAYRDVEPKWMEEEVRELSHKLYPASKGFRIEYDETYKTVKNLMTGELMEIEKDTPACCDPSTETYWSM